MVSEPKTPLISALICTRNRGPSLSDTVSSILKNTHPNFELVIIDQSTNDETENAVRVYASDERLRYVRTATIGKGRALNLALAETKGDVIAITDDDCVAPPNWLEAFARIFADHPKVAVAFCNVTAAPHDCTKGFVPVYVREDDALITAVREKRHARGIGAGHAIRRGSVEKIGGFDNLLGPGSKFPSSEDFDIAVRALLAGYHVYETCSVAVEHFGYRNWEQGRELTRRDFNSMGAAYSKPIKCGRWEFLPVFIHEFSRHVLWPPIWDALRLRKPRITRVPAFVKGFVDGWRTPVDRTTLKFFDNPAAWKIKDLP